MNIGSAKQLLDKEPLLKIPVILNKDDLIEKEISDCVDKILELYSLGKSESEDIPELEDNLNQLVYKLYDLNLEDIQLIEDNI